MGKSDQHSTPEPGGSRDRVPPPVKTAVGTDASLPRTALVAVPDFAHSQVIAKFLDGAGVRTRVAYTADEVLAALETELPGVVIADAQMPVLDGFALLNEILSTPRTANVGVILISDRKSDADVFRAWSSGACAVLTKPIHVLEVTASALRILG